MKFLVFPYRSFQVIPTSMCMSSGKTAIPGIGKCQDFDGLLSFFFLVIHKVLKVRN